ncbi:glycosyltransferase [Pseudomonas sp. NPDC089734]|uniref:glycosyltransferase n=1 Tax=Pseudomonas sp. NPDC089734 TaxID=3364469 RepID=UPI003830BFDB
MEEQQEEKSGFISLPRIAVLLAAYNGMEFIAQQLESILAQQGVKVTVFCSVDLSSDGTEKWIDTLAKVNEQVVLLPYGNRFGGAAPNFFHLIKTVDFSGFDYIALADQDDIWLDDKLRRAHDLITLNTCDAYSGSVLAFWPDGREFLIDKAQPQVSHDYLFEAAGPGCTYVLTVSSALQMKQFLLQQWDRVKSVSLHDWFLYAWYRGNGLTWFIDSQSRMRYRQHDKNQVGANRGFAAMSHRLRLLRSGWYRTEITLIASLVAPPTDKLSRLVQGKGWWAYARLLPRLGQMRRRFRDRVYLGVMILLGLL